MLPMMVSLSSFLLNLWSSDTALRLEVSWLAFALGLCWADATIHATSLMMALFVMMFAVLANNAKFRFNLLCITVGLMLSHAASGLLLLVANPPLMIGLVFCLSALFLVVHVVYDVWRLWATPTAETGSQGCVQDRRERRRQRLHEQIECKKLWKLSRCASRVRKDREQRSRLKSDADWWARHVLETSWTLPRFMQYAPYAVHIPVLLTLGLAKSACLHAISVWDGCNAVANLQQSTQFRLAFSTVLFATWSGRPKDKRTQGTAAL
jgi:hypothetical protein